MEDRVVVYDDAAGEYRWKRVAANNEIIADSGEGYQRRTDCLTAAVRANAGPYILEVDGDIELQTDESGRLTGERE